MKLHAALFRKRKMYLKQRALVVLTYRCHVTFFSDKLYVLLFRNFET